MIDAEILKRFWKDFNLTTQEKDSNFPITNPQDAVKGLIKGRNWLGTFTEMLVNVESTRMTLRQSLYYKQAKIGEYRKEYIGLLLKTNSATSLKAREVQESLIYERVLANNDKAYNDLVAEILQLEGSLIEMDSDKELLEMILKKLEKSLDWLVQYINWCKFEVRDLNKYGS